ncbi:NACHT domain-containing protein [Nonomuraea angiospora]|uniref:NACHT domain-containing protein n=1 Tax=Nonomuraea angiospora TaxID=46172 RepID=UPI003410BF7A
MTVVMVACALNPNDKVNLADLAAVAIAAAVAAATVVVWAKRHHVTSHSAHADPQKAADVLANLVRRQWEAEARNRSLDDPEPIPVRWQLTANAAVMSHPRLISAEAEATFVGCSDDIAALATAFRALTRRRLVITGGPGMGKTTLAMQLLLRLLATRAGDKAAAEATGNSEVVPVPVLLPLSGWNLTNHPRLQDWLADRLPRDYPAIAAPEFGPGAAAALIQGGHILPVLDGLDEIDQTARAAVIIALNVSLDVDDQVILTSRTTEFTAAVEDAGRPLTAAAVIIPTALSPQDAATYLRTCLASAPSAAWQTTLTALETRAAHALAELAATPLGLWLVRAVYITPCTDPTPLTGPLGRHSIALRAHLLDQLIPALIASRPPSTDPADHFRPRRHLDPGRTRRYLSYLARAFPPAATRDIAWWHIGGTTPRIRSWIVLALGLVGTLIGGLVVGFRDGLIGGLMGILMFGLMFGLMGISIRLEQTPGYANLRLRGRTSLLLRSIKGPLRSSLVGGWAGGLVLGLVVELKDGLADGVADILLGGQVVGLLGGLAGGLAGGLIKWVEVPALSSFSTPQSSWRADMALFLLRLLVAALVFGLVVGLLAGLVLGPETGLKGGLMVGLVVGVMSSLIVGNHHAWIVCVVAVVPQAAVHGLPWRIMGFLDDAHRLGLLRAVGPVYQFRHAALHDHLAAATSEDR